MALTYKHQVATGGPAAGEELRAKLKAIVAGKKNPGFARDVAFGALAGTDWPGRDEWFLAQFADPTLREMHDDVFATAPLDAAVERQPDKWIPIVTRLLGNPSRAVHDAAVACLVQFHLDKARADALRPLLPWLANPRWSSARDRLRLIQSVDRLDMKDSVPGLIAVVGQVPSRQHDASERSYAAESLAHFRDPRAVPALRQAISKEKEWDHLRRLYRGLVASGGVSADETVSALEALARQTRTPGGRDAIEQLDFFGDKTSLGPGVGLGVYLSQGPVPDEPIVRRLVERARELDRADADTAAALRAIFDGWKSKPADQDFARRLDEGKLSARSVWAALSKRASLRGSAEADLRRIASRGDGAAAVAAVLLGDAKLMAGLLGGNNADAQAMLLVCARLAGDKLPLDRVSALLASKQGRAAEAAAGYLRADDSPQARRALLAGGGKAQILGNRTPHDPGHVTFSEFDDTEQHLRRLVLAPGGPDEILALLSAGYWGGIGQVIVGVKAGKARLQFFPDDARSLERDSVGGRAGRAARVPVGEEGGRSRTAGDQRCRRDPVRVRSRGARGRAARVHEQPEPRARSRLPEAVRDVPRPARQAGACSQLRAGQAAAGPGGAGGRSAVGGGRCSPGPRPAHHRDRARVVSMGERHELSDGGAPRAAAASPRATTTTRRCCGWPGPRRRRCRRRACAGWSCPRRSCRKISTSTAGSTGRAGPTGGTAFATSLETARRSRGCGASPPAGRRRWWRRAAWRRRCCRRTAAS